MALRKIGAWVFCICIIIMQVAAPIVGYAEPAPMRSQSQEIAPKSAPSGVKLDKTGTVTLNTDKTLQLTATLSPASAESTLTWKSSNKKIAAVSGGGLVTPKKEGTVTITVTTANKKKATVKVKVVDPYKPTGISLNRSGTVSLDIDKSLTLVSTLKPSTAKSKLTWKSSNKKIATVNSSGVVTPKKEGTATITVTTANKKKATVKVKVVDPYKPTGVSLNRSGTVTLDIDKTLALAATLKPSTARSVLTWKSSNKKIVTVNSSGVVTPKKEGTATITVTTGNKKKTTVKVKVVDPYKPTGVSLNKSGTVTLDIDKTLALTATLKPSTARSALAWKSSNKKIATVSNRGVVTPKKEGTVTVTVTTGNKKKTTVKVKVVDPYKPTGVSLNKSGTVALLTQETIALSAALKPATAKSDIKWTTSSSKIATVNANGVVTGKKAGTATITATTAKGSKKATVKVKVSNPKLPTGVSLDRSGTVGLLKGGSLTVKTTLAPADAKSTIVWSSSNAAVVSVTNAGKVTALSDGTATITAKTARAGKTASFTIRVLGATPCAVSTHHSGDGKTHTAATCGAKGHFNCDGANHAQASCGISGHTVCNGVNHTKNAACGHPVCDGKTHGQKAACGTAGHYTCDGKSHSKNAACGHFNCDEKAHAQLAACGIAGHYACDNKTHGQKAACGTAGHYTCSGTHTKNTACNHYTCDGKAHGQQAACGTAGHYGCVGTHTKNAACNHYTCDGKTHGQKAVCGTAGHYSCVGTHTKNAACNHYTCDGKTHGQQAACGATGHYACSGTHTINTACNHFTCDGKTHGQQAACGTAGHYSCVGAHTKNTICNHYTCDGKTHGQQAACNIAGHYACDTKNHTYDSNADRYLCVSDIERTLRIYHTLIDEYGYETREYLSDRFIVPVGTRIDPKDYITDISGYAFKNIYHVPFLMPESNSGLYLNYIVDTAPIYPYTVKFVDVNGVELLPSISGSDILGTYVSTSDYVHSALRALPGYGVASSDAIRISKNPDRNVFTITFIKGGDPAAVPYKIEYVDKNGNQLKEPDTYYTTVGTLINEDFHPIQTTIGEYEFVYADEYEIWVTGDPAKDVIRMIYAKQTTLTLKFVDITTNEPIHEPVLVDAYLFAGDTVYSREYDYWVWFDEYQYIRSDCGVFVLNENAAENVITNFYAPDTVELYDITVEYRSRDGELLRTNTYSAPAGQVLDLYVFSQEYIGNSYQDGDDDIWVEYEIAHMTPAVFTVSDDEAQNAVTVVCDRLDVGTYGEVEVWFVNEGAETLYQTIGLWGYSVGDTVSLAELRQNAERFSGLDPQSYERAENAPLEMRLFPSQNVAKLYYSLPTAGSSMEYTVEAYLVGNAGAYLAETWWAHGTVGEPLDLSETIEIMMEFNPFLDTYLRTEPDMAIYVLDPENALIKVYFEETAGFPVVMEAAIYLQGEDGIEEFETLSFQTRTGKDDYVTEAMSEAERRFGLSASTLTNYRPNPFIPQIGNSWNQLRLYYPKPQIVDYDIELWFVVDGDSYLYTSYSESSFEGLSVDIERWKEDIENDYNLPASACIDANKETLVLSASADNTLKLYYNEPAGRPTDYDIEVYLDGEEGYELFYSDRMSASSGIAVDMESLTNTVRSWADLWDADLISIDPEEFAPTLRGTDVVKFYFLERAMCDYTVEYYAICADGDVLLHTDSASGKEGDEVTADNWQRESFEDNWNLTPEDLSREETVTLSADGENIVRLYYNEPADRWTEYTVEVYLDTNDGMEKVGQDTQYGYTGSAVDVATICYSAAMNAGLHNVNYDYQSPDEFIPSLSGNSVLKLYYQPTEDTVIGYTVEAWIDDGVEPYRLTSNASSHVIGELVSLNYDIREFERVYGIPASAFLRADHDTLYYFGLEDRLIRLYYEPYTTKVPYSVEVCVDSGSGYVSIGTIRLEGEPGQVVTAEDLEALVESEYEISRDLSRGSNPVSITLDFKVFNPTIAMYYEPTPILRNYTVTVWLNHDNGNFSEYSSFARQGYSGAEIPISELAQEVEERYGFAAEYLSLVTNDPFIIPDYDATIDLHYDGYYDDYSNYGYDYEVYLYDGQAYQLYQSVGSQTPVGTVITADSLKMSIAAFYGLPIHWFDHSNIDVLTVASPTEERQVMRLYYIQPEEEDIRVKYSIIVHVENSEYGRAGGMVKLGDQLSLAQIKAQVLEDIGLSEDLFASASFDSEITLSQPYTTIAVYYDSPPVSDMTQVYVNIEYLSAENDTEFSVGETLSMKIGEAVDILALKEKMESKYSLNSADFVYVSPGRLIPKAGEWYGIYFYYTMSAPTIQGQSIEPFMHMQLDPPSPVMAAMTVHHVDGQGILIAEPTFAMYEVGQPATMEELAEPIEGYEPLSMDPEEFIPSGDPEENVVTITYRPVLYHTPGDGTGVSMPDEPETPVP